MGLPNRGCGGGNGLIPKYIGSAYDNVKTVAENIDDVNTIAENIGVIESNATNVATVAQEIDNVVAVGEGIDEVKVVAENVSTVVTVGENIEAIKTAVDVPRNMGVYRQGLLLETLSSYCTWNGQNWFPKSAPYRVNETLYATPDLDDNLYDSAQFVSTDGLRLNQDRMMGYTNKGNYSDGAVTLENEGDYVLDANGDRWFGVALPHTTNPATYPTPDSDPNLVDAESYATKNSSISKFNTVSDLLSSSLGVGDVAEVLDNGSGSGFDTFQRQIVLASDYVGTPDGDYDRYMDDPTYVAQLSNSAIASRARGLLDFIPRKYWNGLFDGTETTDMSQYIQSAIDSGENISQLGKRPLIMNTDSPIFLYGGVYYDFGYSKIKPTDAFGAVQHKVFSTNTGRYTSGQFWNMRNLFIEGENVEAKTYNTAGAGIQFNKDTTGQGLAVYDGEIDNVSIWYMYRGVQDKLLSESWMTKWTRIYGNFCPIGFAKSVGTTTTLEQCYFRNTHQAYDLQFLFGFDMIGCAADAGTDRDYLVSRVLLNDCEGTIHSLRMENNTTSKDVLRLVNSNVNVGVLSFAGSSVDATAGDVSVITASGSQVNIGTIKSGTITSTGTNKKSTLLVSSGSTVTLSNQLLPQIGGVNTQKISTYDSKIYGSVEQLNQITGLDDSYVAQTKKVTLYVSGSGSDSNSGLSPSSQYATIEKALDECLRLYSNHAVTINLTAISGTVSKGYNLNLSRLDINSSDNSSLTFTVDGSGVISYIAGVSDIIITGVQIKSSSAAARFLDGILFPFAKLNSDFSINTLNLINSPVTLHENTSITGGASTGNASFASLGLRDSNVSGNSAATSLGAYILAGSCVNISSNSTLTNSALTNGTKLASSPIYYG